MPVTEQNSSSAIMKQEDSNMMAGFQYHDKTYSLRAPAGDYIGERLRSDGTFYEIDLLEDLALMGIPQGALAFDVGANLGNHAIFFASVMGLEVVAVEPEPKNASFLTANVAENGVSDRVKLIVSALGEKAGKAGLVQAIPGNSGTYTLVAGAGNRVDVKTLDGLAQGRPVALIKIDVEGHEVAVIKGAMETLKAHHPILTTECHSGEQFSAISALLAPMGYSVADLAGRSDNFIWIHEDALGIQRARNVRDAIALRKLKRHFHQVVAATDRISNLVRTHAKTDADWRGKLDEALSSLASQAAKAAEAADKPDLSVYWKSLVDMVGEIRGQSRASDERIASLREELVTAHAGVPRAIESLRIALLRGIGRQLENRPKLEEIVARLESVIGGKQDRIEAAVSGVERAVGEDRGYLKHSAFVDAVGRLERTLIEGRDNVVRALEADRSQALDRMELALANFERVITEDRDYLKHADFLDAIERIERAVDDNGMLRSSVSSLAQALSDGQGQLDQSLAQLGQRLSSEAQQSAEGATTRFTAIERSLASLRDTVGDRDAAHSRRELEINDLVHKLLYCQDQLRTLTAEVFQANSDRDALIKSSEEAKREARAGSLAVRHWEDAYRIIYGSRALKVGRWVRDALGKPQPAYDPSARSALISGMVAEQLGASGMDRADPPAMGLHEVTNPRRRGREPIRAGIATMPGREAGLAVVLDSICPQVDEVFVYLNGFDKAPDCVMAHDNVRAFLGPDVGDRGKFRFIDGYSGYFISIDDDIAYPEFYVQSLIDGIERNGRKAAVGWHGSILLDGFSDYYDPKSRRVLTFGSDRGVDTQVHVLGTGCTAFHTDTIRISYGDFLKPNMADIFFALEGQRQKVPFVVLAHRKGWATPIKFESSPSISGESMKSSGSRIDVRAITNTLVKTQGKWEMPELAAPAYVRAPFTLALIGRTDKERWKKGGILKSSHLTQKMLDPYGVVTHLIDIEKGDIENLGGAKPDVVMIYPGDPDRPDYTKVEYLVDFHAARGRIVLVNLSLNSIAKRNEFVCRRIAEWRKAHGEKVWLMTFTDRAKDLEALAPISNAIFAVPKTIETPDLRVRSYAATKGIFLGDYGKLCDDVLLGFPVMESIAALREALPGVPLFAVKQYAPKAHKDLGVQILPYLSDDYASTLRSTRLMVNLVKYATFEMVPAELAAMGVPVVHPRMSFSLSDYLGLSAFEVGTVHEMAQTAALLYNDPMAWEAASASSELRGASADYRMLSAQMYIRLLVLARRAAL